MVPQNHPAIGRIERQRGFTLIEIAVAVLVITLLLSSILVPLTTQIEQRQFAEAEKRLAEVKEALIGFAAINGYFPCPAFSATIGTENRTAGACTDDGSGNPTRTGFLPWITLGITPLDPWGNLYRYSVDPDFADANALFSLADQGDILIRTRDSAGVAVNLTNASPREIPVVVLSHGRNAHGATGEGGNVRAVPAGWGTGLDEYENATSEIDYWIRTRTGNVAAAGGEFDDIVAWISPNVLMARMVAAGRLP
ncbi:MAG: prepilin-type N-terminal cleavage/methylation domain-containing protein [Burkholderiales bacterium]